MKTYTLGFLFKDGKIILAKKKRKIGMDKWNGYGGRQEEGEDLLTCLCRETAEECGVTIDKENIKELGLIDFYFDDNTEISQKVYIYRIDEFSGYPKKTDEMGEPEEFDGEKKKIPYEDMMLGDDKFIPFVLASKKFKGEVHYSENGEKMISCVLTEIRGENNNEIKLK